VRDIVQSNRFRRDLKRLRKRGCDFAQLATIIDKLAADQPLPARCRPYKLSGAYRGFWECHVEPDWLLIYDLPEGLVALAATGTHADLFG